jgi:hypothetical protein
MVESITSIIPRYRVGFMPLQQATREVFHVLNQNGIKASLEIISVLNPSYFNYFELNV